MAGTEKVPEPSHPDGEHREVFFQHSLGLSPLLFSACPQRHSQDQCSGEAMGRKPLGATASTVLSSSLEFIPRSFKPKGGGGTTVKIVLKEKHKKGKGWRGRVLCPLPELTSPTLGTPGKLFPQQFSTTGCHQIPPQPTSLSHLQPGGPAPAPQPGRIPNHRSRGSSVLGVFWRPWDLGREVGSWKTSRGPSRPPCCSGTGGSSLHLPSMGWVCPGAIVIPLEGRAENQDGETTAWRQRGERQVPASPGGSPTAVPPEGLFPTLGDEALEESFGTSKNLHGKVSRWHSLLCLGLAMALEGPWAPRSQETGEVLPAATPHLPWGARPHPPPPPGASSPAPGAPPGRGGCDIPAPTVPRVCCWWAEEFGRL